MKKSVYESTPELEKEWDYDKNYPLTPHNVSYGSEKRIWWICKNGHGWQASAGSRSGKRHIGCPYCSGNKVCKENSLATVNPTLSKEWNNDKNDGLMPCDITWGSSKKVWWICKKGHEWKASVADRNNSSRKRGCPYCHGKKVCKDNSFGNLHPELLVEWDYNKNVKSPYDYTCGSAKRVHCICKNGHCWDAKIFNRVNGRGCPYCNGKKVCKDNCLATLNSSLSKEWSYKKNKLTPFDYTVNSAKKVWWECKKCNKEWESSISNRNNNGNGCPFCQGVTLKDGTHWDSIPEAYLYLVYKEEGKNFLPHVKYGSGMGASICDFYFPEENKYVEVTSFDKDSHNYESYLKVIERKRKFITDKNAIFEFIQLVVNKRIKDFVLKNVRQDIAKKD